MKEFTEKLVKEIENRIGDKYCVRVHKIVKINDVMLNSLNVFEKNRSISPNIYIEKLYEKYEEGYSINEIADYVATIVRKQFNAIRNKEEVMQQMYDYKNINENLVFRIVNKEMNQKYLKGKVYCQVMDFAQVFYILVDQTEDGMLYIPLSEEIFKEWKMSIDELKKQAMKNMNKKLPVEIKTLNSIIFDMLKEVEIDVKEEEKEKFLETDNVFVMTNKLKMYGATTIFYKDVLKKFALQQNVEELIIVPSSVHEVLLICKDDNEWINEERFQEMLLEVNEAEVETTDLLSNSIYVYKLESEEIIKWKE